MSKKNSFQKNALQNKWMDGIGEIADSYIIEAVNYSAQKRMSREYIKVASIILLCICASVSILLYRGNLSMQNSEKTTSINDRKDESKRSEKLTGTLSVLANISSADIGQEQGKGMRLEEDVEVLFTEYSQEYSPAMSSIPGMYFSFEYSGDEKGVDIKVTSSLGTLRKYEVEDGIWNISEENQVLHCSSGEKIYWNPAENEQSVLTAELFLDDVLQEKKEISIEWDEDSCVYHATLRSKEGKGSAQEIVDEAMEFPQRLGVYAPDLLICNQDYLAFANLRGMIIYDLQKEKLASVIDLQEIDCNNFMSDSRHTCVIAENNEILLFNMKSGKIEGTYYRCSFPNGLEEPKIEMLDSKGKKQMLKEKYKDYQKNQRESDYQEMYEKYIEKWALYSLYGIRWKNEQGEQMQSTLLVEYRDIAKQEIYYSILHENLDKGTWEKRKLNINVVVETGAEAESSDAKKLPAYQYTGKNKIKKAIYNYVAADENGAFDSAIASNDSDVLIPHLMKTYGTFDEGDSMVFFGHLCRMYYTQIGDILESTGGESLTFKAVLQKEEEGYSVKKFEIAKGDGAMWKDSVEDLMKGYPEAKRAFEKSLEGDGDVEKERKRVIRRYVKDNDLKIRYYKDYGWDKVKLPD